MVQVRYFLSVFLVLALLVDTNAQCTSNRYLNAIFNSSRTHEDLNYNQSYALQGACAIETNQSIQYYNLDVYEPDGDTLSKRPCIVYAHGGAFLIGDKRIIPVEEYCYEMAKRGFVVFSIDYRKCFNTVSTPSIERAVYRAVQDMNAAVRWVKAKADTFRIDTNQLYVGGNSAGSIMAIFSTYGDEHERQAIPSTYDNPDLGCLDCSGNYFPGPSKARAVLNYWGATLDTSIIEVGDPPMLSMHGNQDNAVPFDNGVPFSYPAFPPVNGSLEITARLNHLGIPNQLYVFDGMGHEPWLTDPNQLDTIVEKSSKFLYEQLLKPELPQIDGEEDVCIGDTIEYAINGAESSSNYCWTISNGEIVGSNANSSIVYISYNQIGSSELTVQEINHWQAESDTVELMVNIHDYPEVLTSSDTSICEGETVILSAAGGTIYLWSPIFGLSNPNLASPAAFPDASSVYTVIVSNGYCESLDSVSIDVIPAPFVSAGNDVEICKGEEGQLDGWAQGQLYIWSPTIGLDHPFFIHPQASPTVTTNYTLTTIDTITGCQNSDQATVFVNDLPPVPDVFQQGDSLLTYLGYDYQWYQDGNMVANATNYYIVPQNSGEYMVEISDTNGCSNQSEPYNMWVGVEEISQTELFIYPNPVKGELFVRGTDSFNIHLIDVMGRELVFLSTQTGFCKVDMSDLSSGVYLLRVETKKGISTHKVVRHR